jgi:hypothetical protein
MVEHIWLTDVECRDRVTVPLSRVFEEITRDRG